MKKHISITLLALLLGVLLACGGKDEQEEAAPGGEYLEAVDVERYVTLGEYLGLEVYVDPPFVDEWEIEYAIDDIVQNYPLMEEVEGPSEVGDVINIDFIGTVDGVAFSGGTGSNPEYTLGSYQFIADLDEGMVGMEAGEVRDVPVVFPEEYHSEELAGQPANFNVTVHSVMRSYIPDELDDDYIEYVTGGQFDNYDDFVADIEENLLVEAEAMHEMDVRNETTEMAVANAEVSEVPEAYFERILRSLTDSITYYAEALYGVELDFFMMMAGMMEEGETAEEALEREAYTSAERYMVLGAIAQAEGISVSNAEVEAQIAEMAESAGVSVAQYRASIDMEGYKEYLLTEKVVDFLVENAEIVD